MAVPFRSSLPPGDQRRASSLSSTTPTSTASPASPTSPLGAPLPPASVEGLAGLVRVLWSRGGCLGLSELAAILMFSVDDVLPLTTAGELLGFVEVIDGDLKLTESGAQWVTAPTGEAKDLFAVAAYDLAPLVRAITRALASTGDGTLDERFFVDLLRRGFAEDAACAQIATAISWGRYAELFEFEANSRQLRLEGAGRRLVAAAQDVRSA
jgi:NitT/TauT family transport system ATP-binding protein